MNEILEVEETTTDIVETAQEIIKNTNIDSDFDEVTDNLKRLHEKGFEALTDAMELAKDAETPRAWEVVATLLKAVTDINAEVMTGHKKKSDIEVQSSRGLFPNINANNVQNNTFVGTSAELLKILKETEKK
tara:strand:+ start:249 stop:644 length:396 start_codon:yes stop_codon:yes gene_type:complete